MQSFATRVAVGGALSLAALVAIEPIAGEIARDAIEISVRSDLAHLTQGALVYAAGTGGGFRGLTLAALETPLSPGNVAAVQALANGGLHLRVDNPAHGIRCGVALGTHNEAVACLAVAPVLPPEGTVAPIPVPRDSAMLDSLLRADRLARAAEGW